MELDCKFILIHKKHIDANISMIVDVRPDIDILELYRMMETIMSDASWDASRSFFVIDAEKTT